MATKHPNPETDEATKADAPPKATTAETTAEVGPVTEADEATPAGALKVDVLANLSLGGGQVLEVNQTGVTVPDTPEVRDCIGMGYLALSD